MTGNSTSTSDQPQREAAPLLLAQVKLQQQPALRRLRLSRHRAEKSARRTKTKGTGRKTDMTQRMRPPFLPSRRKRTAMSNRKFLPPSRLRNPSSSSRVLSSSLTSTAPGEATSSIPLPWRSLTLSTRKTFLCSGSQNQPTKGRRSGNTQRLRRPIRLRTSASRSFGKRYRPERRRRARKRQRRLAQRRWS